LDKEGEALMADFFAKIDTTIMGRKTAAVTAKLRKSGEMPEMPGITNYVVSRRWKPGKREGFEVVSGSLTAFREKAKTPLREGHLSRRWGRIMPQFPTRGFGRRTLYRRRPHSIGDGIPGFPGKFPQRDFRLTECKSYSNGSVGLRYERMRTKASR